MAGLNKVLKKTLHYRYLIFLYFFIARITESCEFCVNCILEILGILNMPQFLNITGF